MDNTPIIRIDHVNMYFPVPSGFRKMDLKAVDDFTLSFFKGQTVGLVGESGCGKSTIGKVIAGLLQNTAGTIYFHEKDIHDLKGSDWREYRKNVQMIFQDPAASLNPRLKVKDIIAEPLIFNTETNKEKRDKLVSKMINTVGLAEDAGNRYPHEFSGGQQQRIDIARALITKPEFIVCDEAVSALDVSVQAQVLNLLRSLKSQYDLTYLFISHNLAVIKHMCDTVVVMYLGKIVEIGSASQIFDNPLHPYTKALLSAIPIPEVNGSKMHRIALKGELPSPMDIPTGCPFHNRCPECIDHCDITIPELREIESGHFVSCNNMSWTQQYKGSGTTQ